MPADNQMTITLHNLDCLPEMRKMPDRAFELAIVDPPYFSGPDKLGYYGEIISNTKVKRQSYKTKNHRSKTKSKKHYAIRNV